MPGCMQRRGERGAAATAANTTPGSRAPEQTGRRRGEREERGTNLTDMVETGSCKLVHG